MPSPEAKRTAAEASAAVIAALDGCRDGMALAVVCVATGLPRTTAWRALVRLEKVDVVHHLGYGRWVLAIADTAGADCILRGPGKRHDCARTDECLDEFLRAHPRWEGDGHCPSDCPRFVEARSEVDDRRDNGWMFQYGEEES